MNFTEGASSPVLPTDQTFDVIYLDPPWHYNNRKTGGERKNKTKFGGGAMKHYSLMRDDDLRAMAPAIKRMSAPNCAMFMWATGPRLEFALELIRLYGFRYVNHLIWVKTYPKCGKLVQNPGHYFSTNHELLLLGIKGRMPTTTKMVQSTIIYPRGKHSVKPPLHGLIERLYPDTRKLEMFARQAVPGWECWGNEVEPEDPQIQLAI